MAVKGNALKKNKPRDEFDESPAKKTGKKSRSIGLPSWLADGRGKKLTGVFFILLAIYLLFAFSSYLFLYFQWGADDLFSTFSFNRILFDTEIEANNWAGRLGAALSILLIKKGFGAAAFLIIPMLLVSGIYLGLGIRILPVWKTLRNSLLGILWVPVALGFLLRDSDFAVLGGVTGYQSALWMEGLLGKTGTAITLVFALIAILVFALICRSNCLKDLKAKMKKMPARLMPKALMLPCNVSQMCGQPMEMSRKISTIPWNSLSGMMRNRLKSR